MFVNLYTYVVAYQLQLLFFDQILNASMFINIYTFYFKCLSISGLVNNVNLLRRKTYFSIYHQINVRHSSTKVILLTGKGRNEIPKDRGREAF